MPIDSRRKGQEAERELRRMLAASFPERANQFARNLIQSERGGHDLIGLDGYAIEVKNLENFNLVPCWRQTVAQAQRCDSVPVLARKVPRVPKARGWVVYMYLGDLMTTPSYWLPEDAQRGNLDYVVKISYPAFVAVVRSMLDLSTLVPPPAITVDLTPTTPEATDVRG